MNARHHEHVYRRLWLQIAERDIVLALRHEFSAELPIHYPAEDARISRGFSRRLSHSRDLNV
jgi:hypothetical protein